MSDNHIPWSSLAGRRFELKAGRTQAEALKEGDEASVHFTKEGTIVLNGTVFGQCMDLGEFAQSSEAEAAALQPQVSGSHLIHFMHYTVPQTKKSGLILQQVGDLRTLQVLIWDGGMFCRHIWFTDKERTAIDSAYSSAWTRCFANELHYEAAARQLSLWWMGTQVSAADPLPTCSPTQAGLAKRGSGLVSDSDGTLSVAAATASSYGGVKRAALGLKTGENLYSYISDDHTPTTIEMAGADCLALKKTLKIIVDKLAAAGVATV